jgi:transposase
MGQENGKKKRFDKEFKVSAVKMVTEAGHKASEVARSLDIHPNMLYSWKRKYADNGEKAFVGKGHLTEMAALRRKLRNAEMELEILKKALGIFSKPTENDTVS